MPSQDTANIDSSRIDTKLFKTMTINLYLKDDSEKQDTHFLSIIERSSTTMETTSTTMKPTIMLEPMDGPQFIGCKTLTQVEDEIRKQIQENPDAIFTFNVMYDSNDPKKEEHVRNAFELIKKTNENASQLVLLKRKIISSENDSELSEELQNKFVIKKEVSDGPFVAGPEIDGITNFVHQSLLRQHSDKTNDAQKSFTPPKNNISKEQINQADSQTITFPLINTMTIGLFSKDENRHSLYVTNCKNSDRVKAQRGVIRTEKDLSTGKIKQSLFNLIDDNPNTSITIALIYDADDNNKETNVRTSVRLLEGLGAKTFRFSQVKRYVSSQRKTTGDLNKSIQLDRIIQEELHITAEIDNLIHVIEGEMQTAKEVANIDDLNHDLLFKSKLAKLAFLDAVQHLADKEESLRKRKHGFAADAIYRACKVFREEFEKFNSEEIKYEDFAKICNKKIKEEEPELKEHRGYGRLLANIGLAILGLGVFYGVALLVNKKINGHYLFFYHNKTDSEIRLEEVKGCIPSMAPSA